jgi:uncharacterized protein YkwD
MIVKLTLCALALAIGATQTNGKESAPAASQKVEQAAPPQAPAASKPQAQPQPSAGSKAATASPAQTGLEEKELNGVRLAAIEVNMVSYTNQERARFGLPPLQVDKDLMESARGHAAWMTRNRAMIHTNQPVAENIAMGQPHSSDVVRSWMNSAGHRANILNFGHRRIGVAAFRSDSGTIFWCQQFRP